MRWHFNFVNQVLKLHLDSCCLTDIVYLCFLKQEVKQKIIDNMSYIEKNLMDGEQIVYEARQHWIIYWLPALLLVVAVAQFAFPLDLLLQACIALALAAIAGIWALNIYGGRKYILTTKRLILKRGIVKRESLDLILRRCEGVSIKQSIIGRILDYGTVVVSTGEVANSFERILNPVKFSSQINQQIAQQARV